MASGGAPGNRVRWATLTGLAAATFAVAAVDPAGAVIAPCPSRLIGLDCPACGGLRGTHDLLRGHVVDALDHNLLLPAFLVVLASALVLWLGPLVGRPARALTPSRSVKVVAVAVVVTFTALRNLPVGPLQFLASGT